MVSPAAPELSTPQGCADVLEVCLRQGERGQPRGSVSPPMPRQAHVRSVELREKDSTSRRAVKRTVWKPASNFDGFGRRAFRLCLRGTVLSGPEADLWSGRRGVLLPFPRGGLGGRPGPSVDVFRQLAVTSPKCLRRGSLSVRYCSSQRSAAFSYFGEPRSA